MRVYPNKVWRHLDEHPILLALSTRKRDDEHLRRFHKGIPLRVVKIIPEVYRDHEGSLQFRMCLCGVYNRLFYQGSISDSEYPVNTRKFSPTKGIEQVKRA